MSVRRALAALALAAACVTAPAPLAYAEPSTAAAPSQTGPQITADPERPAYQLTDQVVLSGRVTNDRMPVPNALVLVTLDHDIGQALTVHADADGQWRLELPPRAWDPGLVTVQIDYLAGPGQSGATDTTSFLMTTPGAPVTLAVAPVAGQITQGQELDLFGSLKLADGRPVPGMSLYVVTDPSGTATGFATTDEQGNWRTRVRIPDAAGTFDGNFPTYTLSVNFDGDNGFRHDGDQPGIAPASARVTMTLSGPPVQRVTPTPTPKPEPGGRQNAAPTATPLPKGQPRLTPPSTMPSPTSPGVLLGAAGLLATIAGAAMISHGRD